MRLQALIIVALFAATAVAVPKPIEEPDFIGNEIIPETFGDAVNVKMLADLLDDEDPLVREQAVRALGETHNTSALPHIHRALDDESTEVRSAAVTAAAEYPINKSGEIVLIGLASDDGSVLVEALRSVRRMRLTAALSTVEKLLQSEEPLIQAISLDTLSDLDKPAPPEILKDLLSSGSPVVRLRAAENAILLADAGAVLDDLQRLARKDVPAVRAAALAAVGKFAFESNGRVIASASTDENPLVRRGALWAYTQAGLKDKIKPFLDDTSAMVRLAASESAGAIRCTDCVGRLFEIMLSVIGEKSHLAARQSLQLIGTQEVADQAADVLQSIAPRLPRRMKDAVDSIDNRNAVACSWLLGELRTHTGYELQLKLMESLVVDSPVLAEIAIGLGKIGDKRAVKSFLKIMPGLQKNGARYLRWTLGTMLKPCPVPYSPLVSGRVIDGLGELADTDTIKPIIDFSQITIQGARLKFEPSRCALALGKLAAVGDQDAIEKAILLILENRSYSRIAKLQAARIAGSLKIQAALPAMRKILNEDRPDRLTMQAMAWAIQQITDTTPEIPDPKIRQGNWIVKKARR